MSRKDQFTSDVCIKESVLIIRKFKQVVVVEILRRQRNEVAYTDSFA